MESTNPAPPLRNDPYRNIRLLGGTSERWNTLVPPLSYDTEAFAMTIADMDFPLSEDVRNAIVTELSKPDTTICYVVADQSWRVVVADWIRDQWGFEVNKELLVESSGLFPFLSICIDAYVPQGGSYVLLTPVCDIITGHASFSQRQL